MLYYRIVHEETPTEPDLSSKNFVQKSSDLGGNVLVSIKRIPISWADTVDPEISRLSTASSDSARRLRLHAKQHSIITFKKLQVAKTDELIIVITFRNICCK